MPPRIEWLESDAELLGLLRSHGSYVAVAAARGVSEHAVRGEFRRRNLRAAARGVRDDLPDNLPSDVEDGDEIPVFFRDYTHLDHLYVYPLGDIHKGSHKHQRDRWQQWVDYLADKPDRALLNTGDNINAGIIGSKSDVYDEVMTVGQAKREFRDEVRPLAEDGRLDLIIPGNHENRIERAIGDDPMFDVAEALDVPYARAAAVLVYRVGDVTYDFYVRHGTGNGQSLAQLSKSMTVVPNADVYVTGHTHRQAVTADDVFVREGSSMTRKHRYYVSSGSFLGYENYAAQRGYAPTRVGAPRVFLNGERHEVHVSI
jgi:UDP-2,3-diacylglucosamine pyrophosphatase LpxH